ncbi:MAG: PQQ-binding-like beta-propeller repeat protein [Candidatus Sumerlaeota bacterium]
MKIQYRPTTLLMLITVIAINLASAQSSDWPNWRGPGHDGSTASQAATPQKAGLEENLLWQAKLPGDGASTPIILGNQLFASAEDSEQNLWAVCLDINSGEALWQKNVGKSAPSKLGVTKAAPSPVTDGERVIFLYSTGLMVAFDMAGTEQWSRDIQDEYGAFELLFDYGPSPLLHDNKLIIPVIHGNAKTAENDKSYLLCLDAPSGETTWKHERKTPTGYESKQAYTTPYPIQIGGKTQIVILGGDHLTGHDPVTGKELWRSESYNPKNHRAFRVVPMPVSHGSMLLAAAPRASQIVALDVGKMGEGELQAFTWTIPNAGADVCTPLAYKGRFYVLDGRKRLLRCIEPKTGKVLGETRIENTRVFDASPTASDGKIYMLDKKGTLLIYTAEETPRELGRLELNGKNCRSSVAIADSRIFVRINERLYCFGDQ